MFGLGMQEILLILAIALIVIGPQKLPEVAKLLGRAIGEFKRSAQDLKNSIDIETTVKEVKPAPAKKKLKDTIKDIATEETKVSQASDQQKTANNTDDLKAKTPPEPVQESPASPTQPETSTSEE